MKGLDLDQLQHVQTVQVSRATLTIVDRRNGEIQKRDFYRGGNAFPFHAIAKELEKYGFDVLGYSDETTVEGEIDFEMLFASMMVQEAE